MLIDEAIFLTQHGRAHIQYAKTDKVKDASHVSVARQNAMPLTVSIQRDSHLANASEAAPA